MMIRIEYLGWKNNSPIMPRPYIHTYITVHTHSSTSYSVYSYMRVAGNTSEIELKTKNGENVD